MRRKKKIETTDGRYYTKKGDHRSRLIDRMETQERSRIHLRGRAITKPWRRRKNDQLADVNLTPPPLLRADIRDQQFGDGTGKRSGFTVPDLGARRQRRRGRNAMAKESRRRNRGSR